MVEMIYRECRVEKLYKFAKFLRLFLSNQQLWLYVYTLADSLVQELADEG